MKSTIFVIFIITLSLCRTPQQDYVRVTIPGVSSDIYSGPLQLSSFTGETIQYMMFSSQSNKTEDPLILWLTGGPGCSSFLATHYQNGPYVFIKNTYYLKVNDYSWNRKANLLYFESPQGVGFSQGTTTNFNDQTTALATYEALLQFFNRFTQYKGRKFYLSGSGYAASYLTYLSKLIIEKNAEGGDFINLKGILLGNPCISPQQCWQSGSEKKSYYHYQHLYQNKFYTQNTWNYFKNVCDQDYNSYKCYQQRQIMDKMFNNTDTSIYNINEKCEPEQSKTRFTLECQDQIGIQTFLNDAAIKNVYHLPIDKVWEPCNAQIFFDYVKNVNSYQILPYLIQNNIKIWIYSGETDSSIPIIGTKKWIQSLKSELSLEVLKNWRTWISSFLEGEIGGQMLELKGLTFTSVRNAGFRASMDRPNAMYSILEAFLNQAPL